MIAEPKTTLRASPLRRAVVLMATAGVVIGASGILASAPQAQAQTIVQATATPETLLVPEGSEPVSSALWSAPANLSTSGSASSPRIAAETDGTLHVLWWDKFDGTKYSYSEPGGGWAAPLSIATIVGLRTRRSDGTTALVPPGELTLLSDQRGRLHAFWRNSVGDLLYARGQAGTRTWTAGTRLVTNPLAWRVYMSSDGSLNLAFIRWVPATNAPAGVYFRRSRDGSNWTNPLLVVESLYFRTLPPSDAFVSVIANGQGTVIVGWDDPQTLQSHSAMSTNSGQRFAAPEPVQGGEIIEATIPRRVRFVSLANSGFLRMWEAGDSCVLYQQQLTELGVGWSAPLRALETVSGCLRFTHVYDDYGGDLAADRTFMSLGNQDSLDTLVAWDGLGWATPSKIDASFVNLATNDLVVLGCLNVVLGGNKVSIVGCDPNGDVWALTSAVGLPEFLPAAESAWGRPLFLSGAGADADIPAVSADQQGRIHVLWSRLPSAANPESALNYLRGDGLTWSDTTTISSATDGSILGPSLLVDPNEMVHAVWSTGPLGQVVYSRAFARDALLRTDWAVPARLPTLREVGKSPQIRMGASGTLYAAYAIPFNEDRGVYLSTSNDLGSTWTDPVRVFDAAAAGWTAVTDVNLVIDRNEQLHLTWARATVPDRPSPNGVFYARSADKGATWLPAIAVSVGADSHPVLAAVGDSDVHIVWARLVSGGYEVWHRWSPDQGANWSTESRVTGLGFVSPDVSLITDAAGSVHLVGLEKTREDTSAVFYLRWNGQTWVERDSLRIGVNFAEGSGVRAALASSGVLGVVFRVRVPAQDGKVRFAIGYAGRRLNSAEELGAVATFTPRPPPTSLPAATAQATFTPVPTPEWTGGNSGRIGGTVWVIGLVILFMAGVSVFAVARLWKRIGR